jgi:hypothetical protein
MLSKDEELTMVKMMNFANEFLKVAHGIKVENDRGEDRLPDEIQEYLANQTLDQLVKEENLEPEMLIWGMVNIIEILLRFAEIDSDELSEMISLFVKQKREELNG